MVLKQIQDLLHDHDCVIIPDFGGLIAQYASSKIHPVKHTFTPPSKKIAFNEKLKHNDGLLISHLAQHLKVPSEQAQQMVNQFVGNMQTNLVKNKRFELQGIGIFRLNAEHKIEFEYLEGENFLADSFGLPELEARPIIPSEATTLRTIRQKAAASQKAPTGGRLSRFSRKYATVAGTVLLGSLTVAMVYVVSLQPEHNLSSLNPVTLFSSGSERTLTIKEKVAETDQKEVGLAIEELPVTPEENSIAAVEADFSEAFPEEAAAVNEEVALAKVSSHEIAFDAKTETPVNATEAAPKSAAEKPEAPKERIETAAATATKKAEAKLVANSVKPEAVKAAPGALAKTAGKETVKTGVKAPEKNNAESPASHTINAATGRYFIISGGYLSLANAERSKDELTAKGAASDIILPTKGSKLHRVSVAEFETMELATANLPELRKKFGNSLWILNY
ncbi:HU domain-containing protein [Adhaeribacter soli]|uniref:SPOR domain-containing protein n=1 Tax=Adhaeribacter soli TaxID=2607655 RepID=A0A5N1IIY3_9BACT|nr:HU family DNA-binding protein [Adhaeribacter soli]KAA9325239.1 hypothetical protein F0P94_18630 [Adhaeribacter soli]